MSFKTKSKKAARKAADIANRRVVCWLENDPASIVAAKLAIRANDFLEPIPLVIVAKAGALPAKVLDMAMRWLDMPIVMLASQADADRYFLQHDRHVVGIPVDEQARHDELQTMFPAMMLVSILADRSLTRADCIELVARERAYQVAEMAQAA